MHKSDQENTSFSNIENLTEAELAGITQKYPYYSPGQFWLLSNYKKNNAAGFDKQAEITTLFFQNSRWLSWQLYAQLQAKQIYNEAPVSLPADISAEKKTESASIADNKTEDELAFEPLHMVDYFASQGIKISDEALLNDKLGTQLKSFTEWLKSMKKIHADKIAGGDDQTDKMIQHIAEGSNTSINVVTEAMAEVLLKQGKAEQAIEIYQQLSLNNPSGSAYFAAKINSLKTD